MATTKGIETTFVILVDTIEYVTPCFGDIIHKFLQFIHMKDQMPVTVFVEVTVPLGSLRFEIDMGHVMAVDSDDGNPEDIFEYIRDNPTGELH